MAVTLVSCPPEKKLSCAKKGGVQFQSADLPTPLPFLAQTQSDTGGVMHKYPDSDDQTKDSLIPRWYHRYHKLRAVPFWRATYSLAGLPQKDNNTLLV